MLFDSILPLPGHAHSANAQTVLLVDRYVHLHPMVALPRPELSSTENLAANGPLAYHIGPPSERPIRTISVD